MHDVLMVDLSAIVAHYAPLLRLGEWEIQARWAHQRELRHHTRAAELEWCWNARSAIIRVVHPEEQPPAFDGTPFDVERLVVHELVHLRLCQTLERDVSHDDWEIESIARALVALRRRADAVQGV